MSLLVCNSFLFSLFCYQIEENVKGKKASIVEVKRAINQIIDG